MSLLILKTMIQCCEVDKLKLEEASRNELLALAKGETITRYNKSQAYKGFSINNIDTTSILKDDILIVTCQVGDYNDTIRFRGYTILD